MTKIVDRLMSYPGVWNDRATAHLRVYTHEDSVVAIIGQLTDHLASSVSNQIELIVAGLEADYGDRVIIVEHHPAGTGVPVDELWASVTGGSLHPVWTPLSTTAVEALAGEPVPVWPAHRYSESALRDRRDR
ncbi:hypothetical protein [Pseudonocardia xishanensis]|uniref:Uncharacterized protein n=1 Tax=Pseudonocardia xishanensis TaxID=630995 RepID=A0ABP8S3F3_9PSEU